MCTFGTQINLQHLMDMIIYNDHSLIPATINITIKRLLYAVSLALYQHL